MRHALLLTIPVLWFPLGSALGQGFSEAICASARRRCESIEFEISLGTKVDWAGSYYYGNGTGANYSLSLAPHSGFVLWRSGCMGIMNVTYGRVESLEDRLVLVVEKSTDPDRSTHLRTELYPVRWDQRRYLISGHKMQRFINDIASGSEPRRSHWGCYFLRQDESASKVEGRPQLPAAWSGWLLDEPLHGKVIAVRQREDTRIDDDYRGPIELTLDIGSAAGVLERMRFFPKVRGVWLMGRVIAVEPEHCTVEITMSSKRDPLPRKGWMLSTRAPLVNPR